MALPSGMGMMLKSLGINPEQIVETVNGVGEMAKAAYALMLENNERTKRIEAALIAKGIIENVSEENGDEK